MRILFMQLLLPIACYFIGVAVGKRIGAVKITQTNIGDDSIQHVGYTPEQMGYDK